MFSQFYILPILLFSVVVHEVAHGWMALRLGDTTARDLGRLTLNPIPHIDPVGSVIIPLLSLVSVGRVFIAWAKPVPINPLNFTHVRRDDIFVSVVGPLSNIFMACVCTACVIIIITISPLIQHSNPTIHEGHSFLLKMFSGGITLNIVLAVFNMIPIPPLDGSHVMASLLPATASAQYRKVGFLGIFAIMLLMQWAPFVNVFDYCITTLSYPFTLAIHQFI